MSAAILSDLTEALKLHAAEAVANAEPFLPLDDTTSHLRGEIARGESGAARGHDHVVP